MKRGSSGVAPSSVPGAHAPARTHVPSGGAGRVDLGNESKALRYAVGRWIVRAPWARA
jgi:hypothetical protein